MSASDPRSWGSAPLPSRDGLREGQVVLETKPGSQEGHGRIQFHHGTLLHRGYGLKRIVVSSLRALPSRLTTLEFCCAPLT